ncbi:hypothetical protein HUS23_08820 [Ectothiorhodospiraceae bacterium 2226]|nr:hypothetical protein HUS23_08820 [Ectothiorhodospiraceae bacterium 2226]
MHRSNVMALTVWLLAFAAAVAANGACVRFDSPAEELRLRLAAAAHAALHDPLRVPLPDSAWHSGGHR